MCDERNCVTCLHTDVGTNDSPCRDCEPPAYHEWLHDAVGMMKAGGVRFFAKLLVAYNACPPDIQAGVLDMAEIITAEESDPDDVGRAVTTLTEALWPQEPA